MSMGMRFGASQATGVSLDTATTEYVAAQGANAFTGDTLIAVDNTIRALKTSSLWSATYFDAIYFLANPTGKTGAGTLVNAFAPGDATIGLATAEGSIAFDTVNGYGWTGANQKYLDTKLKSGIVGRAHQQNSCHGMIFLRTVPTANDNFLCIGFADANGCGINPRFAGGSANKAGYQVHAGMNLTSSALTYWTGMWCYNRTASNALQLSLDGANVRSNTTASNAPPDMTLKMCATATNNRYCDSQCSFASFGGALTDARKLSIYEIVRDNYLTPLGISAVR